MREARANKRPFTEAEQEIIQVRADFDSAPSRSLHASAGRVGWEARNNITNKMCKFKHSFVMINGQVI